METAQADAPVAPPPPPVVLPHQPNTIYYYEVILHHVSRLKVRDLRNYVRFKASLIDVTGYIQTCRRDDLRLGYEGTEDQCREFTNWLLLAKAHYRMFDLLEFVVYGERGGGRVAVVFDKIKVMPLVEGSHHRWYGGWSLGDSHGPGDTVNVGVSCSP